MPEPSSPWKHHSLGLKVCANPEHALIEYYPLYYFEDKEVNMYDEV